MRRSALRSRSKPVLVYSFGQSQIKKQNPVSTFVVCEVKISQKTVCALNVSKCYADNTFKIKTDVGGFQVSVDYFLKA